MSWWVTWQLWHANCMSAAVADTSVPPATARSSLVNVKARTVSRSSCLSNWRVAPATSSAKWLSRTLQHHQHSHQTHTHRWTDQLADSVSAATDFWARIQLNNLTSKGRSLSSDADFLSTVFMKYDLDQIFCDNQFLLLVLFIIFSHNCERLMKPVLCVNLSADVTYVHLISHELLLSMYIQQITSYVSGHRRTDCRCIFIASMDTLSAVEISFHLYGLSAIIRETNETTLGGATGRTLDLRSTGRVFKSYLGQSCVTTLGKLFTPMCLCHQAV